MNETGKTEKPRLGAVLAAIAVTLCLCAALAASAAGKTPGAKIRLTAGAAVIEAVLDGSRTSQDFLKTLPRTMTMTRYGDREFYGKLGSALSNDGEKIETFQNGDVTYYEPGGSFAIFYDKEKTSSQSGLIRMGKITSDLAEFGKLGDTAEVRIEAVK